jgi:hypothetical protein
VILRGIEDDVDRVADRVSGSRHRGGHSNKGKADVNGNRAARGASSARRVNGRGILPRSCELRSSSPHGVVQSRILYQPKIKKLPSDLARRTTSGPVPDRAPAE